MTIAKKTSKRIVSNLFYNYEKRKKNNFLLKGNIRADAFMTTEKEYKKYIVKRTIKGSNGIEAELTIIDKKFAEKYSPDNVDSCHFWKQAVTVFPFASVSYSPGTRSKKSLNKKSFYGNHERHGSIEPINEVFGKNPKAKMLEIGPGYGCVKEYIEKKYSLDNYYAIDVNPLFDYKKLYKTDGSTIPKEVPDNLDIVYSVNVFQHLSEKQKLSYYTQIRSLLKPGGKFIFSMFVVAPDTINSVFKDEKGEYKRLFGMSDIEGNFYVNFFSQFTVCPRIDDIIKTMSDLEFDLEIIDKEWNSFTFVATKK